MFILIMVLAYLFYIKYKIIVDYINKNFYNIENKLEQINMMNKHLDSLKDNNIEKFINDVTQTKNDFINHYSSENFNNTTTDSNKEINNIIEDIDKEDLLIDNSEEDNNVEEKTNIEEEIKEDEIITKQETITNIDESLTEEEQINKGLCTYKFKKRGFCQNPIVKNQKCKKHIYR